jgi:hypothetical protein
MVYDNSYVLAIVPFVSPSFYSWKDYFIRELDVRLSTAGEA